MSANEFSPQKEEGMTETTQNPGHLQQLRNLQEHLIQGILRAMIPLGFLAVAAGVYDAYLQQEYWIIGLFIFAYLSVLAMALLPKAPYSTKVWALLATLYIVGFADFFQDGRSGSARVFFITMPFIAGVFSGKRASIIAIVMTTFTTLAIGSLYSFGSVVGPADSTEFSGWVSGALVLAMLGTLMVVALDYLVPRLSNALAKSQALTSALEEQSAGLAQQVKERTAALERRSQQLETTAQIVQEVSSLQDAEKMINRTVQLVPQHFGHYHAAVFMLNRTGEYAVLQAANSEGGQRMLARGHRLHVGKVGIVGYVASQGEPWVAHDVGADPAYFDNPDMPYTRSELALPLRVRGQVIGVLDIQSKQAAAFDEDDITILQSMADQIANAISNVQLNQELQERIEAERHAYGELSRQAWRKLLQGRTNLRERFDPENILPSDGEWPNEMKQAIQDKKTILFHDESTASLAIPLWAHNEIIGVINAHKPAQAGGWASEEISLLETLTEQLNVALESARLYQETQRQAERDRLIADISAQVRSSTSVDTVLHTAIRELGRALRASGGLIQLETESALNTITKE